MNFLETWHTYSVLLKIIVINFWSKSDDGDGDYMGQNVLFPQISKNARNFQAIIIEFVKIVEFIVE